MREISTPYSHLLNVMTANTKAIASWGLPVRSLNDSDTMSD
ncbi:MULTISPECIES: hypothetical protein [unclassified Coleofasciculus]|nr:MULTISPECIES: hypothetical protein [unclassified Coleofasciculus]